MIFLCFVIVGAVRLKINIQNRPAIVQAARFTVTLILSYELVSRNYMLLIYMYLLIALFVIAHGLVRAVTEFKNART